MSSHSEFHSQIRRPKSSQPIATGLMSNVSEQWDVKIEKMH